MARLLYFSRVAFVTPLKIRGVDFGARERGTGA